MGEQNEGVNDTKVRRNTVQTYDQINRKPSIGGNESSRGDWPPSKTRSRQQFHRRNCRLASQITLRNVPKTFEMSLNLATTNQHPHGTNTKNCSHALPQKQAQENHSRYSPIGAVKNAKLTTSSKTFCVHVQQVK